MHRNRKNIMMNTIYPSPSFNSYQHIANLVSCIPSHHPSPSTSAGFFFFFNKFIYLFIFLAALGLRCCVQAFPSCGEQELPFVAVRGLLIAVASLVAEHGLQGFSSCGSRALERRLSSCGTRPQLLRGMWDLPGPGLEPMPPALADRFLTTVPPEKSL